jgi:hypothetical protein
MPRRNSSDFLFGKRGFSDWAVAKAKLDQRVGIAPWTLHDLRRTCATQLGELGVQPHRSARRCGDNGRNKTSRWSAAARRSR